MNVVVESAVTVPVLFQEPKEEVRSNCTNRITNTWYLSRVPEGVSIGEVLELDQCILPVALHNRCHEFFDEVIVLLALYTVVPKADVVGVLEEAAIVGSHIQSYGQTLLRLNPCANKSFFTITRLTLQMSSTCKSCIQRQFAHRDSHAMNSQVSEAQDPLPVSDNDGANVILWPVAQEVVDVALVVDRDEQTLKREPEPQASG